HFRAGSRDGETDILERRDKIIRPAVMLAPGWRQLFARRDRPALAGKIAHRPRRRAVEGAGRIMPGLIRLSVRVAAARIVIEMLAAVPSPCRHVDAAAKGDAIVDHDDFLVMRRGKRMGAIQLEGNALVPFPAEDGEKSGAAEQRLDGARIPAQQSDLKVWRAVGEPENEIAEFLRPLACVITETDAGIEIPSDQIDAVPRLQHGLARHDEIISRIDN